MSVENTITGGQIRAARGFLRWSANVLAVQGHVAPSTIQRAEGADGVPPITLANLLAIKSALEAGGVEFLANGAVRMAGKKDAKKDDH